jgi:hypothetical protein
LPGAIGTNRARVAVDEIRIAQLQAIYEEAMENMFYDVSGQQRPNRSRH